MKSDGAALQGRRTVAQDPASRGEVTGMVSLSANALVQTRQGALPAAHLMPGDDLVARDGGYARLLHATRVRQQARVIWVRDGFLDGMRPEGGLLLPVHQPVLRRELRPVPVPVSSMVALGLAEDIGVRQLTVIQLWLETADTIYGGGLELPAVSVARHTPGERRARSAA